MSDRTDALVADAHTAVAVLKATTVANKEAALTAFVASALATHAAVKASRGGAVRLAALNKEAGVGYGSPAAVGFHAVTGHVLSLPVGEVDEDNPLPSPTGLQALVKKVGQEVSKEVLKTTRTQAAAVLALEAAKAPTTLADHLAKARKALEDAAVLRVSGAEYDQAAQEEVDVILAALDLVVAPQTVTVSKQAEVVAA